MSLRFLSPFFRVSLLPVLPLLFLSFAGSQAQAQAPSLVGEARWMTKGEDPTCLSIYPLYGRSASAEIYIQVDLSSTAPVEANQVEFFLENAQLLPEGFSVDVDVEVIKGNGSGATVQAVMEVFNEILWESYTEGATLTLKMRTSDGGSTQSEFTLGEVCLYGPKGILPDSVPPGEITEATINEGNPVVIPAELTEDEFEFQGSARASDVGKGIQYIQLAYRSPFGDFLIFEADMFGLTEGSLNDGLFAGTGTIARYAEEATYDLISAVADDKYGNAFAVPVDQLPDAVQKTVVVTNPMADITPPELTSPVLIDPDSVEVPEDDTGTVTFSFSASDAGSGVSFGTIRAFHKTDVDASTALAFFSPDEGSFLQTGDASDGTYEVPLEFLPGTVAGDYSYEITLFDNAFRSKIWGFPRPDGGSAPNLPPAGSDETIIVINNTPQDTTPPVLNSITCTFVPNTLDDKGPGTLEFTLAYTEDESDLNFGFFGESSTIRIISPTGATEVIQRFPSFTDFDFFISGKVSVPLPSKFVEPGDYCVEVTLVNTSGFSNTYGLNYDHMPFPGGFDGTCEVVNSGPVDCAAPVPVEFSVNPGFILPGQDATLSVTMRITDGLTASGGSGFEAGWISLLNGISDSEETRQAIGDVINFAAPEDGGPGTGTRYDGTYSFEFPVTGSEVVGDFLSFQFSLTDCAGNTHIFDTSLCDVAGGYPLPFQQAQIGAEQENRPPSITSNGGGATAQINLEEGITQVTTVTATDPDLPGDTLTLSVSGGADSALFGFDANTGALTFLSAPAFDSPGDANNDNVYEVTVQVSDAEAETDSQEISVTIIPDLIGEDDYDAYANGENSPFPSSATAQQKALDFDFDGDGISNGDEFAAGTDPTDSDDLFWALVAYEGAGDAKVIFWPYTPDTNIYTLYQVFEGSENNERSDTGLSASVYEGDSSMGCFEVNLGGSPIESFLAVGAMRTSL